jgi:hypothetical protein
MQESVPRPLPPREFLEQIMDTKSKIYCFLWDRKDEEGKLSLSWDELAYLFQKNSFRTCMRKMKDQKLLKYREHDAGVKVEMFNWND